MQFNWLHLTDLHRGMRQQQWMWSNVAEQLAEDLAHLRPQSGPWDLILFTGDLTDRGSAAQFSEVDEVLAEIKSLVAKGQGGREPILLAVPGNHDLQRPSADDAGLRALQGWAQDPAIIEGPAQAVGLRLAPDLSARLQRDAQGESGGLALLGAVLQDLFDQFGGRARRPALG